MKVYRYYEPHSSGGISRVQLNENQIIKFMQTSPVFKESIPEGASSQEIINLFIDSFKAKEDLNPPKVLLANSVNTAERDFQYVRSYGLTPKEAFENAKSCAEYSEEYSFILGHPRYYVIAGLSKIRDMIKDDEDIQIVLSEIQLPKTRPRTIFMLPLSNNEFLLFLSRRVSYEF